MRPGYTTATLQGLLQFHLPFFVSRIYNLNPETQRLFFWLSWKKVGGGIKLVTSILELNKFKSWTVGIVAKGKCIVLLKVDAYVLNVLLKQWHTFKVHI